MWGLWEEGIRGSPVDILVLGDGILGRGNKTSSPSICQRELTEVGKRTVCGAAGVQQQGV